MIPCARRAGTVRIYWLRLHSDEMLLWFVSGAPCRQESVFSRARDSDRDVCASITGSLKCPLSHSCEPSTGGREAVSCSFQRVIKYGGVLEELLKICARGLRNVEETPGTRMARREAGIRVSRFLMSLRDFVGI